MDFTLTTYLSLLSGLKNNDYCFQTVNEFLTLPKDGKVVIMRHDIDKFPENALAIAKTETRYNIKSTYYFRSVPESWNEQIIKEIDSMGHEVGYHYESLTTCNGDTDIAYQDFYENLERLRKLVDVKTICMHGSPYSKFDSKDIWLKYSYKELGIIGEPYLDIDFSKVFYLTDTGRRWDGYNVSVRDKISVYQKKWIEEDFVFKTTCDIIKKIPTLSKQYPVIMITTHPQRWTDNNLMWISEFLFQHIKNVVKRVLIKAR
jgi:hypothetical protein